MLSQFGDTEDKSAVEESSEESSLDEADTVFEDISIDTENSIPDDTATEESGDYTSVLDELTIQSTDEPDQESPAVSTDEPVDEMPDFDFSNEDSLNEVQFDSEVDSTSKTGINEIIKDDFSVIEEDIGSETGENPVWLARDFTGRRSGLDAAQVRRYQTAVTHRRTNQAHPGHGRRLA